MFASCKRLGPVGQSGKENESASAVIRTIHGTFLRGLSVRASTILR
jgi:hypothetical protein